MITWGFVKKREQQEGRRIKIDTFIEQYFGARENINRLKATFGNKLHLSLLDKNLLDDYGCYYDDVDCVEDYISEPYSKAALTNRLKGEAK